MKQGRMELSEVKNGKKEGRNEKKRKLGRKKSKKGVKEIVCFQGRKSTAGYRPVCIHARESIAG